MQGQTTLAAIVVKASTISDGQFAAQHGCLMQSQAHLSG
jgi:hypothetical protein